MNSPDNHFQGHPVAADSQMTALTRYETPDGFDDLLLFSDGEALTGILFEGSPEAEKALAELERAGRSPAAKTPCSAAAVFRSAARWLDAFFTGRDPSPAPPWRAPRQTPFQRAVQAAMLAIPRGETRTYGQIAADIAAARGLAKMSAQAVGQAVGANRLCLLVPCHRVVAAGGKLGGYGGGLENKMALLRLEGAV